MNGTFSIKTLGCKLNRCESALIARALSDASWVQRPCGEAVDLAIVNTCTVTRESDRKSRNWIRRSSGCSHSGQVVVTGCLVDRSRNSVQEMPQVVAAFGNREKHLVALHARSGSGREHMPSGEAIGVGARLGSGREPMPPGGERRKEERRRPLFSRTDGYIKIQEGCSAGCAYCVVPGVRGPPRSRDVRSVLQDAQRLISGGCPELTLTGTSIGQYRAGDTDLAGLVDAMLRLHGRFRVRISSIEPLQVTERLMALFEHDRLCFHLHIPIQSGSDQVLRAMRRPYRISDCCRIVERVRDRYPAIAIGTDMMVGFPAEADEDFARTLRVVERLGFAYVHQFAFSARPGTPAWAVANPNGPRVIEERRLLLREAGFESALAYRKRFLGATLPCVVEPTSTGRGHTAVSDNYLKIELKDSPLNRRAEGSIGQVELLSANGDGMQGALARKDHH